MEAMRILSSFMDEICLHMSVEQVFKFKLKLKKKLKIY